MIFVLRRYLRKAAGGPQRRAFIFGAAEQPKATSRHHQWNIDGGLRLGLGVFPYLSVDFKTRGRKEKTTSVVAKQNCIFLFCVVWTCGINNLIMDSRLPKPGFHGALKKPGFSSNPTKTILPSDRIRPLTTNLLNVPDRPRSEFFSFSLKTTINITIFQWEHRLQRQIQNH